MKAQELINKIANLVGVELASMGSDVYAALEDGTVVYANAFSNGNIVLKKGSDEKLADGEYQITVEGEQGPKLYNLVIMEGVISNFDLMPQKGEQKMNKQNLAVDEKDYKEAEGEKTYEESPAKEKKQEELNLEEVVAALIEKVAALEDMMKGMMEKKEEVKEEVEEMGDYKEQKMSKSKKFNGAPAEQPKIKNLINPGKTQGTIDRVWERIADFN